MLLIKRVGITTYHPSLIKRVDLHKNNNEQRKGEFNKITTETLQLNKTKINYELIKSFIKSAKEVSNTANFSIELH